MQLDARRVEQGVVNRRILRALAQLLLVSVGIDAERHYDIAKATRHVPGNSKKAAQIELTPDTGFELTHFDAAGRRVIDEGPGEAGALRD